MRHRLTQFSDRDHVQAPAHFLMPTRRDVLAGVPNGFHILAVDGAADTTTLVPAHDPARAAFTKPWPRPCAWTRS